MIKKYIVTDDYKPLYALRRQWGPECGPLKTPTPVTLDIIHDLLHQVNPPTLYEVVPTRLDLTEFTERVELTKQNFELPYEQILAQKIAADAAADDSKKDEISLTQGPEPNDPIETEPVSDTEQILKSAPTPAVHIQSNADSDYTEEELEELLRLEEEEAANA